LIYTNKKQYPGLVANAISNQSAKYSKGDADISTTQLIDAPMQKILKERHADEITVDVSDMVWSFYGSMGHAVIDLMDSEDLIFKERRFSVETAGWITSGQPDYYYRDKEGKRVLSDFKFARMYSFKDGVKSEYVKQLNVYRYLLERNGFPVDRLELIAFFRDADYATDEIQTFPIKMYKLYKIKEYMEKRVAMHRLFADELIGQTPECTPKERWQNPDRYCVMKKGNSRQTGRDYMDKKEAELFLEDLKTRYPDDVYSLKTKKQKNKRCENYCSVSKFCWWWNTAEAERPDTHNQKIEGVVIN